MNDPLTQIDTVTENIAETVARFHMSKDYESVKVNDEQGVLKVKIGLVICFYFLIYFNNNRK